MRCMHEAKFHDANSFVTLTYDEQHHQPSLDYSHFQDFIRRIRRSRPARFFAAGEYGENTKRPHWHALLFGVHFNDLYPVGNNLYGSKELEKLWPWGFSSVGEVNETTAAYVASYCIKKATGRLAAIRYSRVNLATGEIFQVAPEMARMSLKPGIGAKYFEKYKREIYYARDGIVSKGGQTLKPPRYYDKLLIKQDQKQYTQIETDRQLEAITRRDDNTPERLKAKEIVAIAKQSQKQRKL